MKKGNDPLGKIGMILLLGNLFFLLIRMLFFSPTIYRLFFQMHHLEAETDLRPKEAQEVHASLLAYLNGRQENILVADQPLFSQREMLHMQDVKALLQQVRKLQRFTTIIGIGLLAIGLPQEQKREALRRYMQAALIAIGSFLLWAAIWILADFNAFWAGIHQVLFPHNDYWLLDPDISLMVNMYPAAYWRSILLAGVTLFSLLSAGFYMDFSRLQRL